MFETFRKNIKGYVKASFFSPLFVSLEVILEILIPLIMASIIDKGVTAKDVGYVVKMGALMLLCACLSLTFGVLSGKFSARASTGLAKNLRKSMFDNIQNFSFTNIDKYTTAGLITRLTTDVTNVQNAYEQLVRIVVRSPLMSISAFCMAISISPRLSVIFLCAIAVLITILSLIITRVHPRFKRVFEYYDNINSSVQENVSGIRVIKSFVREESEIEKFTNSTKTLKNLFLSAERLIILNMPVMQCIIYSCILLLSWFGAHMVVSSELSTGDLAAMFTYVTNILMSLMMLSMTFVMLTMSRASAERISEVCKEQSTITNPENPVNEVKDGSIKFENVFFSYLNNKDKMTLKNINLEIKSGETIGIIGGTGSGKSALVQLIPRLYDTFDGNVFVGGVNVKEYDVKTLRDNVAMVLQKNVLFSGTIKDNLRWGNKDATDEEIIESCRIAQAEEFIENMPDKYDTFIERGGTNVSGGQRQRLCIARALIKKPKIIILDDSTSAVDTKTDVLIRNAFKEYIPDTTKIIIAQRVSSIKHADKIIVIDNTTINAIGTHEELIETCDIYKEIYTTQQKGDDK